MRVDPESAVRAFMTLQDQTPIVQQAASIAVMRTVMDTTETATLTLLQSLEPHLGQRIDIRV